jgi:hypothetical protein
MVFDFKKTKESLYSTDVAQAICRLCIRETLLLRMNARPSAEQLIQHMQKFVDTQVTSPTPKKRKRDE